MFPQDHGTKDGGASSTQSPLKAFQSGDGIANSVWFMQMLIKHHQDNLCPLNIAFMDVKKAFDSVSHQSILVAAAHLGVPPLFLGYLRQLYSNAQTRLRIGTELSNPIKLGWGVRQGDPMSVHSFNAVIDLVGSLERKLEVSE